MIQQKTRFNRFIGDPRVRESILIFVLNQLLANKVNVRVNLMSPKDPRMGKYSSSWPPRFHVCQLGQSVGMSGSDCR
jgi:hypothetical protein